MLEIIQKLQETVTYTFGNFCPAPNGSQSVRINQAFFTEDGTFFVNLENIYIPEGSPKTPSEFSVRFDTSTRQGLIDMKLVLMAATGCNAADEKEVLAFNQGLPALLEGHSTWRRGRYTGLAKEGEMNRLVGLEMQLLLWEYSPQVLVFSPSN